MINVFRPHFDLTEINSSAYSVEGLTRDVNLKPIHSHNDYWRKRPLYDALLVGAVSVEGDIWHFQEDYTRTDTTTQTTSLFKAKEIYVGHNQIYLEEENTLENVYFDPLFRLIESANRKFTVPILEKHNSKFGPFYNSPELTLYFWLDLKTDGVDLVQKLKPRLKPFLDSSYLQYFDHESGQTQEGPLAITLTGDVPWDFLEETQKSENTHLYVDCPLQNFVDADEEMFSKYEKMCIFASASLEQLLGTESYTAAKRDDFTEAQQEQLRKFFDAAHSHGIKTRIWGGVDWPVSVRHAHWDTLWRLGCDLINADDLLAAANFF